MTLNELAAGQQAVITTVGGQGGTRQHFLDMGMIPGAALRIQKFAPMGDPMEVRIHNYELVLTRADAAQIGVTLEGVEAALEHEANQHTMPEEDCKVCYKNEHPGLGEEGRYHEEDTDHPAQSFTGAYGKGKHKGSGHGTAGYAAGIKGNAGVYRGNKEADAQRKNIAYQQDGEKRDPGKYPCHGYRYGYPYADG